jgi:ribosomal protein L18E
MGELTKKLTLVVSAISASAKAKVEAKGGSVELIAKKAAPARKAKKPVAPAKQAAPAKP